MGVKLTKKQTKNPFFAMDLDGLYRISYYDLEAKDSTVKVLGDDTLKNIAREPMETVRNNATIDWTVRETVHATLRVMVKRILRKYGYPPEGGD